MASSMWTVATCIGRTNARLFPEFSNWLVLWTLDYKTPAIYAKHLTATFAYRGGCSQPRRKPFQPAEALTAAG
jgi:hypothetical protein